MTRFHVNPESGNANKCRAVKGRCPFGVEFHADSLTAARQIFENNVGGVDRHINDGFELAEEAWSDLTHGQAFSDEAKPWVAAAGRNNREFKEFYAGRALIVHSGGAAVNINADVGSNAIIITVGGGATVSIGGDVGDNTRIAACGGGAKVVIAGKVGKNVQILSEGGGAQIHLYGEIDETVKLKVIGGGADVLYGAQAIKAYEKEKLASVKRWKAAQDKEGF